MKKLNKNLPSKDFEKSITDWAGESPPRGFDRSKKWNYWGKNNKFRANFSHCGNWAVAYNWSNNSKQTFYKEGFDFKNIKIPQPPETKNISEDFNKLSPPLSNHPYLIKKNISIQNLNIKRQSEKLVIPVYSTERKIISWQTIDQTGKKLFKKDCQLGKAYHFPIGAPTGDRIYICEGIATGATIYSTTKARVYCAFSKGNLDHVATYCLKQYTDKTIVLCLDNDGPQTHKTKVDNKKLTILKPEKTGDFNDYQFNILEKIKLINLKTHEIKDDNPKAVKMILSDIKNFLIKNTNTDMEISPQFWDDKKIIPRRDALLLTGGTECGKTAFSLKFLENHLKEGVPIVIWEHSETNRHNRLNKWIKGVQTKNKPYMSYSILDIISQFKEGSILFIDDTDGFLKIKNPLDRREVGDALGDLSIICQLMGFTAICCHYQTKTSKTEKDIKSRAGGGMVWVNKIRYFAIIEKGKTGEVTIKGNELKEDTVDEKEKSFITIRKGHRPGSKEKSWWLNDDYTLGPVIQDSKIQEIIKEKIIGQDNQIEQVLTLLNDYMKDQRTNKIKVSEFYNLTKEHLGLGRTQTYNYLKKINTYKIKREGFGKGQGTYIFKALD